MKRPLTVCLLLVFQPPPLPRTGRKRAWSSKFSFEPQVSANEAERKKTHPSFWIQVCRFEKNLQSTLQSKLKSSLLLWSPPQLFSVQHATFIHHKAALLAKKNVCIKNKTQVHPSLIWMLPWALLLEMFNTRAERGASNVSNLLGIYL